MVLEGISDLILMLLLIVYVGAWELPRHLTYYIGEILKNQESR